MTQLVIAFSDVRHGVVSRQFAFGGVLAIAVGPFVGSPIKASNVRIWGGKRTFAKRALHLHRTRMPSASFVPTEADLIAANRLHFWASLKWKRTVRSYALGGLVFALTGTLYTEWDSAWAIIVGATVGFVFWSFLLACILAVNYILIPPRSRRAFRQMKTLQSQTEINWSPDRIQLKSAQGSSDFDWRDFIRIIQGREVILLLQSDYLFNFIPKRALSDEQTTDLATSATERRA